MKSNLFAVIFLLTQLSLTSCLLQKRLYMPGFHVESFSGNSISRENFSNRQPAENNAVSKACREVESCDSEAYFKSEEYVQIGLKPDSILRLDEVVMNSNYRKSNVSMNYVNDIVAPANDTLNVPARHLHEYFVEISLLSIMSAFLGFFVSKGSIAFFLGAILIGVIVRRKFPRSAENNSGRNLAMIGIVAGVVGLLLILYFVFVGGAMTV